MKAEDLFTALHALALQVPEYFEAKLCLKSETQFPSQTPRVYTSVKIYYGVLGQNVYEDMVTPGSEELDLKRIGTAVSQLQVEHLANMYANVPNL